MPTSVKPRFFKVFPIRSTWSFCPSLLLKEISTFLFSPAAGAWGSSPTTKRLPSLRSTESSCPSSRAIQAIRRASFLWQAAPSACQSQNFVLLHEFLQPKTRSHIGRVCKANSISKRQLAMCASITYTLPSSQSRTACSSDRTHGAIRQSSSCIP